jgi:Mce-associated membrane protein
MTTKTINENDLDDRTDVDAAAESSEPEAKPYDAEADDVDADGDVPNEDPPSRRPRSPKTLAAIAGAIMIVAVGAVAGWLGLQLQHTQQAADQRAAYLQAARQGAINLTTIDWQQADGDVKRIVDNATGTFYDDFSKRAQPFVDVVKQVQSKTTGTVTMAGLESMSGDQAQALVAVTVNTTNAGAPEPTSKAWRMRIDVQKVGDDVKVANVEFVP